MLSRVPFRHLKSKKESKKHKTLVSMQASAPGTITVRLMVQTSVGECEEMVLSSPAVKKKKKTYPPPFSETWTGPLVVAGVFN